MKIKVLGSNSSGNCYVLESSTGQKLIIEAGIHYKEVIKSLNFDISNIAGLLVSHRHGDHFKYAKDFISNGVNTFIGAENVELLPKNYQLRVNTLLHGQEFTIGQFKVKPFEVKHDVPCFGFLINHPEMGNTVFITDTHHAAYKFPNINNVILEANYCENIIADRFISGSINGMVRNRVLNAHMSLQTAKGFLELNDLSKAKNIILIHLSESNADPERFEKEVSQLTGIKTFIAKKGAEISLTENPF